MIDLSVLSLRRMNGPVMRLRRSAALGSRSAWMGTKNLRLNSLSDPRKPGFRNSMIDHRVAHVVLYRRSGQGNAVVGFQRPCRSRLLGLRVLDVLGLVEHHAAPWHILQELDVPLHQSVAGDDDGVLPCLLLEPPHLASCRGRDGRVREVEE